MLIYMGYWTLNIYYYYYYYYYYSIIQVLAVVGSTIEEVPRNESPGGKVWHTFSFCPGDV